MKIFLAFIFAATTFFNMTAKNFQSGPGGTDQGQKPLFSFGIIADVQYANYEAAGSRFYKSSLRKLRSAVTSFKEDSVDFIINLGDLIDRDYKSYLPVMNIIDSSGIKTYHVTGNHDYAVDSKYKRRLPVSDQTRDGYYSFVHENFRFVFINGNEVSTYITNNKTAIKKVSDTIASMKERGEINAVEWNGGIGTRQLTWLDNQIKEAEGKNEKVFLICHFPVVPENVHNMLNYKEVLPVLEKYRNIVAWFNGHNHAGNYGNFNMIHFITFKGMVETEASNSFAVVEVYRNKLWIRGSGREKSQILAY
jgi:manganese-dependent ADP-ribose/CDP-alcohol diphosphatase